MKNEERIIELLAEYLQKTDKILGRLDKNDELYGKQLNRMDTAYTVLIQHSEEIEALRKETLKHSIQQEEILKEIFSISKTSKRFGREINQPSFNSNTVISGGMPTLPGYPK